MRQGARGRSVGATLVLLLLLLVALGIGRSLVPGQKGAPPAVSDAAALVDGHAISQGAFQQYRALFGRLYDGPRPPANSAAARTVALQIADRAIDQAIGEYLIARTAARRGLQAPARAVLHREQQMIAAAGGPTQARVRWGMDAEAVHRAATLAVLEETLARQRHDRHWLEREAQGSMIVYFVGSRSGRAPWDFPAGLPGHPAPDFVAHDLRGRTVALAGLRGRPAVLLLWQRACLGCGGDLLLLETFARRHPMVQVVAVDEGDRRAAVRATARQLRLTYMLWVDELQVARDLYSSTGLPATYILDSQGEVREMNLGPLVDYATLEGRAVAILHAPRG